MIGSINTEGVVSLWDITKVQSLAFRATSYPVLYKTFSLWGLLHIINNRYDSRTRVPLGEIFPMLSSVKVVGFDRCNNAPTPQASDLYSFSLSNGHVIIVDLNSNSIMHSTWDIECISQDLQLRINRSVEYGSEGDCMSGYMSNSTNNTTITNSSSNTSSIVTEITGGGIFLTSETKFKSNSHTMGLGLGSGLGYSNSNSNSNDMSVSDCNCVEDMSIASCMVSLGSGGGNGGGLSNVSIMSIMSM